MVFKRSLIHLVNDGQKTGGTPRRISRFWSHTSLDAIHAASTGWLAAQGSDPDFISTYARDNPAREDIAESFLPWLALRYRSDRIDPGLATTIETTIPARLAYFDAQGFVIARVK